MSAPRRYRRIPTEIEAVEFVDGEPLPQGVVLMTRHDGEHRVWNALHDSFVGVKPGDFLRVDDLNDVYPIDRATFEATYLPVGRRPELTALSIRVVVMLFVFVFAVIAGSLLRL